MRINLNVPFNKKDDVKRLGARWDPARKTWFIENEENIISFWDYMPGKYKTKKLDANITQCLKVSEPK